MISKQQLIDNTTFYILIGISLFFFLIKGIVYSLIGSYWPIFVFSFYILLLLIALKYKNRFSVIVIRFWAISLIIWGGVRLLIAMLVLFTSEITENHIHEEFDFWGILITLIAVGIGIFMLKNIRSVIKKSATTIAE